MVKFSNQVHIPRVVIVATSSQLNGQNVATVDRKPINAAGVGGQRMQNPLPSAPIILQPPTTITLKSVQQHSSTTSMPNAIHHQQPTEPQMIHPQAMVPVDAGIESTSSHSRQVMVIQSSNANHEQIGGNCQTITVSGKQAEIKAFYFSDFILVSFILIENLKKKNSWSINSDRFL